MVVHAALPHGGHKAPVAISDPWTGFYVGGNVGYSWGRSTTTTTAESFIQAVPFGFVFPGGSSATSVNSNGVVAGGQIGYNWRVAPNWLAGIETDIQWSGQKGSGLGIFSGSTTGAACTSALCTYTNATDITAKLSWFGTLRGRVGAEWNGLWFYGTGGLAYGKVSVSGTNTLTVTETAGPTTVTYSVPFSYSKTKLGWSAGAGIEGVVAASNWMWRVEYLHIDLGSIGGASFVGIPALTLQTGKFTDEIVRVAFNYRFAAAGRP